MSLPLMREHALEPRLREMTMSPTLDIIERCRQRAHQGLPVAQLGLGQSPFPIPDTVVEALRAAATEKATIIVDHVNADPRYLACSLETRSEIVVPIMKGDRVLGEIDIDSHMPAAFGPADRTLLESVAQALADRLTRSPGGDPALHTDPHTAV